MMEEKFEKFWRQDPRRSLGQRLWEFSYISRVDLMNDKIRGTVNRKMDLQREVR